MNSFIVYFTLVFGSISPDESRIPARLAPPERNPRSNIYLRTRHPQAKPIQSVTLNGKKYDQFDADKEKRESEV